MDLDQGGRQLAGLVLDAAGRGQHDQVADLIAPLDVDQLRSLVTVLAVQVDQTLPSAPAASPAAVCELAINRSEEHTSELQSLMRISYAVFCLKKKKKRSTHEKLK